MMVERKCPAWKGLAMLTDENSTGGGSARHDVTYKPVRTEGLLSLSALVAPVTSLVRSRIQRFDGTGVRVLLWRGKTDLTQDVEVECVLAAREGLDGVLMTRR